MTELPTSRSIADRAGDPEPDAQDGFFDEEVDDPSLLRALEKRQRAKEALKDPQEAYKKADAAAKALIAQLEREPDETGPAIFRVGRFRIKLRRAKGQRVSFETSDSTRTTISLIKDA